MFRQIPVYLVSICLLSLLSFRHPYHVSVTTLHYLPAQKTLDIEVKVFYHDLEPAVNKFGHANIDIKHHENKKQRDSLVFAYTKAHFSVMVDGKQISCTNRSVDFKDEYIFIRMAGEQVEGKTLTVNNTFCFEMEPTQTNFVHFTGAGNRLTKKTVNPKAEVTFLLQ